MTAGVIISPDEADDDDNDETNRDNGNNDFNSQVANSGNRKVFSKL